MDALIGLTVFAAGAFYIDMIARSNAKDRTAEVQVKRLQAEATRDRTKDWERHRSN